MNKLQMIRKSKNMSQSELARKSGVNFRTLQDFDQGRKSLANAKGEMIYRLSLALECSTDELLSDTLDIIPDSNSLNLSQKKRMLSYLELMNVADNNYYNGSYSFPVLYPRRGVKMEHIYPTKQKLVAKLHDVLTPRDEILAVMLFGSSISMRCTYDSDTDLAIRLNESFNTTEIRNDISEIIQNICDWNADILWFDRISSEDRVYHDICKGVQIV